MPPTKSQKAAKIVDSEDDNQGFVEKQREMYRAVKTRQDEARSRIRKNRDNKQKELQARIKALKRIAPVQHSIDNNIHVCYGQLEGLDKAMAITNVHVIVLSHNACCASARLASSGNETDAAAPSPDLTAFDALRDLLARKTDIEQRIAQNIESLEKAMQTTYREFQVVLASRTQLLTSTKAPADANAASTAIILKP
ncbi:hypothetical protein E4T44_02928 [Aureobasidium sp. EXF-8845]|nr:hypothetical protein E4T44_02928 [Aureobasidium sp. EXF-8845]KAI4854972.1 hypothetical protein E4T45_03597 [Aureobasidium sp. EXF-8846]